ncbi:MAG: hypothetical protein O7G85_08785 [Planctomycetota bacterium]|nr:hypothetical protein [Planctomycetota bacterium]
MYFASHGYSVGCTAMPGNSEDILRLKVCPQCRYDLRGQVEFHCPECGYEYDAETFVLSGWYAGSEPTIRLLIGTLVFSMLFCSLLLDHRVLDWLGILYLIVIGLGSISLVVKWRHYRYPREQSHTMQTIIRSVGFQRVTDGRIEPLRPWLAIHEVRVTHSRRMFKRVTIRDRTQVRATRPEVEILVNMNDCLLLKLAKRIRGYISGTEGDDG